MILIQISPEQEKALREVMNKLSEKQQEAMNWLIANYDVSSAICKAKILTEAESRKVINRALQKNDDYLLALALLERILNTP